MLRELSVQNLALIEDAHVELQAGYCVWTGETGAGKSLLLTALGLVLGGKASADLVRNGKAEARAAAVFEIGTAVLRAELEAVLGGPIDGDELILTRRIAASGKTLAMVNDLPVTISTLRQLGACLIDIHGQHEGRFLLDPERQKSLLDAYGKLDRYVAAYGDARSAHAALRQRRIALEQAAERRQRERDLLEFERDELASLQPVTGENDELTREAHRLANVEQIRSATTDGYELLYEADHSAQELLETVARKLEPLAETMPELAEAATELDRIASEVREVAYALRNFGRNREDDPDRLDAVEARLAHYRKLSARFRCAPDELAQRQERVESQLAAIEHDELDLKSMDGPLSESWNRLKKAARSLSIARKKAGKDFAVAVQSHFKPLNLAGASIEVKVDPVELGEDPMTATPGEHGADHVEIVFSPNPGEEARPLRKIASGGELSRVTLAAKSVLAEVDCIPTLVFDEIDTGVGGRLGAVLGRTLAKLAEHRQVLCVTHLPQMASYAKHQWVIRKSVTRGRTRTSITSLNDRERVVELAAMLRGDSAAETTRAEALAMLCEAQAAS